MIVLLVQNPPRDPSAWGDLTPGQVYSVIGIESESLRILNDAGQPYLYPASLFEVRDPSPPPDWVEEIGDDGERYAYPPTLYAPGFFESFFDADPEAVATFWRAMNSRLSETA